MKNLCPICKMPTDRVRVVVPYDACSGAQVCSACQNNHLTPVVLDLQYKIKQLLEITEILNHNDIVADFISADDMQKLKETVGYRGGI